MLANNPHLPLVYSLSPNLPRTHLDQFFLLDSNATNPPNTNQHHLIEPQTTAVREPSAQLSLSQDNKIYKSLNPVTTSQINNMSSHINILHSRSIPQSLQESYTKLYAQRRSSAPTILEPSQWKLDEEWTQQQQQQQQENHLTTYSSFEDIESIENTIPSSLNLSVQNSNDHEHDLRTRDPIIKSNSDERVNNSISSSTSTSTSSSVSTSATPNTSISTSTSTSPTSTMTTTTPSKLTTTQKSISTKRSKKKPLKTNPRLSLNGHSEKPSIPRSSSESKPTVPNNLNSKSSFNSASNSSSSSSSTVTTTTEKVRHSTKILLTEEEKRNNHIESEKKRRQNIRSGFTQLVEMVPQLQRNNRSEALILKKGLVFSLCFNF